MPLNDSIPRRTLDSGEVFEQNAAAPFVEFGMASAFSFLRGASEPVDLAITANLLGYDMMGIADYNSVAGAVRLFIESEKTKVQALIGCRLVFQCGTEMLAYPQDHAAYKRLVSLLSWGKTTKLDGSRK